MRRDLAVARDLAGALQTRLDSTSGQSFAATHELTTKLADCEAKLRSALDEVH